ncbi:hypothetical protein [Ancylobacter polymorphus]|nr:hypothetical protein [Ancylobacter polymorphus]
MTYTIILDGVPLSPCCIAEAAAILDAAISTGRRCSLYARRSPQ